MLFEDSNDFLSDLFGFSDYDPNRNLLDIIAQLEYLVGNNFENQQERGAFRFRYPVRIVRDDAECEAKGGCIPNLKLDELDSVRYVMGANSLYIGRALLDILKYLEYRYIGDLDFTELEKKYQAGYYKDKGAMTNQKLEDDLLHGLPMDHLFDLPKGIDD